MQGGGLVCSSGCREVERLHRLREEERHYRDLVEQIKAIIAVFTPRMTAAGNPGAARLGHPQTRRRSRLIGQGTTEKVVLHGPLGWRVASVGTGEDPESTGSIQLVAIGLDIDGRLVDLTRPSQDPPAWTLGGPAPSGAPPREYDDYDYRYIAEREVPRSLHELLEKHTQSGLPDQLTRCYYCGHAGFHKLSPIGSLWTLENWPRTCEDCIQCWVGP